MVAGVCGGESCLPHGRQKSERGEGTRYNIQRHALQWPASSCSVPPSNVPTTSFQYRPSWDTSVSNHSKCNSYFSFMCSDFCVLIHLYVTQGHKRFQSGIFIVLVFAFRYNQFWVNLYIKCSIFIVIYPVLL
jgi:hypothetical protein